MTGKRFMPLASTICEIKNKRMDTWNTVTIAYCSEKTTIVFYDDLEVRHDTCDLDFRMAVGDNQMKGPIDLDRGSLSGIITMLLMQAGRKEFTLTYEESKDFNLEHYGLDCTAEFDADNFPTSITVTIIPFDN